MVASRARPHRGRRTAVLEPPARAYDLDDAKGIVELLADELGMPAVTYEPPRMATRSILDGRRRPAGGG